MYLTEREEYMMSALRAIAAYGNGEPAMCVLRSYMLEHGLTASVEEDVRRWLKRIAEDAIAFPERVQRDQRNPVTQQGNMAVVTRAA